MSAVDHKRRHYQGLAEIYDEFRPTYPSKFLTRLAEALTTRPPDGGQVLDVGAGTGIFSRQLRKVLPADMPIVGVEPNGDMREKAQAAAEGLANVTFLDGAAESLPVSDGAARAVLAATAAHWFSRPAFYAEAARALRASGVLAIVEYFRDQTHSPIVQDLLAFLTEQGANKAPPRPDYAAELQEQPDFTTIEHVRERHELPLTFAQFVGLALSTPLTRPAIARLGQSGIEKALYEIAGRHAVGSDQVRFGYVFQYFLTRRVS